ncbi:MAG: hypothetical protein ACK5NY_04895 [Burkholderiaceae bacterium]
MFTKQEVKEFIIKLGKRWFFPEFYTKVTWYVITLGAGIILTPTPLKLLVCNWLIDSFNLNSGKQLTLSEMGTGAADYWRGFALIVLALLHNIFSKWLLHKDSVKSNIEIDELNKIDKELFLLFTKDFPADSRAVMFLRDVDLGGTYHEYEIKEIEAFIQKWDATNYEFHDAELEKIRVELLEKSRKFILKLANNSYCIGSGPRYRCVPDQYVGDFNYPTEVDLTLRELNAMATELYKLHSKFIRECRKKLKC